MVYGRQRQRHGVTWSLVEGLGGFIVGAALVVFLGELLGKRPAPKPEPEATDKAKAQVQTEN